MKKILVATHGNFAEGIISSINLILGEQDNLHYMNAYLDEVPLKEKIKTFFEQNAATEDVVIIFTDLFGGSVNQAFLEYMDRENTHFITGVNLPLLLEAVMLNEVDVTEEKLKEIVKRSKEQIIYTDNQKHQTNEAANEIFDI
ncbi:PTS sugar transporter subunit IIA [Oceanobacillus sp. FSL W8-0428]|uniref:PTS sugar transporter subunit IIA n=1 Tax=Oceanobacillus sp. FSL W8-0428 TaxID=2921715 RepID=UPI0030FBA26E